MPLIFLKIARPLIVTKPREISRRSDPCLTSARNSFASLSSLSVASSSRNDTPTDMVQYTTCRYSNDRRTGSSMTLDRSRRGTSAAFSPPVHSTHRPWDSSSSQLRRPFPSDTWSRVLDIANEIEVLVAAHDKNEEATTSCSGVNDKGEEGNNTFQGTSTPAPS
jgi:hypothetical protein